MTSAERLKGIRERIEAEKSAQRVLNADHSDAHHDRIWLLQHITEQQREIEVLREEIDGMAKTADRWIAAAVKAGVGPAGATAEAKGYRKQERPM